MSDNIHLVTARNLPDSDMIVGIFNTYINAYNYIPTYLERMGFKQDLHLLSSSPLRQQRVKVVYHYGIDRVTFIIHTLDKSRLQVIP